MRNQIRIPGLQEKKAGSPQEYGAHWLTKVARMRDSSQNNKGEKQLRKTSQCHLWPPHSAGPGECTPFTNACAPHILQETALSPLCSKNSLLVSRSQPLFLIPGVGYNASVALRHHRHTAFTQRRRQLAFTPNVYLLPLGSAASAWNIQKEARLAWLTCWVR